VALLFSVGAFTSATAEEAKMPCDGVNSCRGQGFKAMAQKEMRRCESKRK
jgi:hypothetical protein